MKNLNELIGGVDEVLNSVKGGNFEEVLTKTKNYAEIATRKSAERLEISKKKIELLDSKTKLSKAYEKYGKLQYSIHEGNDVLEAEIKSSLAEIQLLKTKADYLDNELKELKELFVEPISKNEPKQEDVTVETEKQE